MKSFWFSVCSNRPHVPSRILVCSGTASFHRVDKIEHPQLGSGVTRVYLMLGKSFKKKSKISNFSEMKKYFDFRFPLFDHKFCVQCSTATIVRYFVALRRTTTSNTRAQNTWKRSKQCFAKNSKLGVPANHDSEVLAQNNFYPMLPYEWAFTSQSFRCSDARSAEHAHCQITNFHVSGTLRSMIWRFYKIESESWRQNCSQN